MTSIKTVYLTGGGSIIHAPPPLTAVRRAVGARSGHTPTPHPHYTAVPQPLQSSTAAAVQQYLCPRRCSVYSLRIDFVRREMLQDGVPAVRKASSLRVEGSSDRRTSRLPTQVHIYLLCSIGEIHSSSSPIAACTRKLSTGQMSTASAVLRRVVHTCCGIQQ